MMVALDDVTAWLYARAQEMRDMGRIDYAQNVVDATSYLNVEFTGHQGCDPRRKIEQAAWDRDEARAEVERLRKRHEPRSVQRCGSQ